MQHALTQTGLLSAHVILVIEEMDLTALVRPHEWFEFQQGRMHQWADKITKPSFNYSK